MITDERIASFINSFNSDYDDVITAIRKEAEEQEVPIIRREAGEFIKLLIFCYFYEQVFARRRTYYNDRELSTENRKGKG